jgi:hypothetical protein
MVAVAEKPPPRARRRGPSLADRMLGAGGRFLVGVVLLGAGAAGLYLSNIVDDVRALMPLDLESWKALTVQLAEPRTLAPAVSLKPLNCVATALAGLLLVLSSFQPLRWLTLLHYGCAVVTIAGPWLGVPAVESFDPALVSLAAGGGLSVLLLVVAGLRRPD